MSEKEHLDGVPAGAPAETQSSDVSRETTDLVEIMDRSLPKAPDPPEDEPGAKTPSQEGSAPTPEQEESPALSEKNKPSSFYVYLVILFGAAFMMLLLAYFVQKHYNETAITDLRNTMNLSREQLMEENRQLEEDNLALQKELDSLRTQTESLQKRFDYLSELHVQLQIDSRDQLVSWADFWAMAENFRAGDYKACAGFYKNVSTPSYYTYATPESAQARYDEIYQFLTEHGYFEEAAPAGQGPGGGGG